MIAEELRLQKEKVRVFELARELDMESKDLLDSLPPGTALT